MPRIVLGIEYDGTNYYGWQHQKNSNLPTIQQQIEKALSCIANQPISTICAGRTDARVHAMAQVVHFDTTTNRKIDSWILGVNRYLPPDIRVLWSKQTEPIFNARRSAISRTYYYFIYNSKVNLALFRNYATWQYKSLNIPAMQQASGYWIGEHDFISFRGKDCQSKTTVRTIHNITISMQKELIQISITANAFLKNMVRNMVGVLIKIGREERNFSWAKEVLLAKNRKAASITAPPEGLYLAEVGYPEQFKLPQVMRRFNII
ncbi:MAG: tRNA pseudouridine(38-40) synthase TruA [Gammaproteobacteria bacterium]|jgi:tRNA pseudouridine38-40 synthase